MPPQSPAAPTNFTSQPVMPQPQPAIPPQPVLPPQPAIPPQPQIPASPMQLNPAYGHDKLATASLILGIVSLPASILNLLTLPIPIIAIVLGIISLKHKKSFAIAGIVLGVIGIILSATVLVVGTKIINRENNKITQGSQSSLVDTSSSVTSSCFSFNLPKPLINSDLKEDNDCNKTFLNSSYTDDIVIVGLDLDTQPSSAETDTFLKNTIEKFGDSLTSGIFTNQEFTTLDGVRAYQALGTQNYGNYRHLGVMAAISPKEYTSTKGEKLRVFLVVYDSATNQNVLSEIAKSWQWK